MRRRSDRRSRRRRAARSRAAPDAPLLLGLRPPGLRPRPRAEQRHAEVRPRGGDHRRQRLRRHGDHRRRLARLDRPRRGGRPAVDDGALPAQGRQLPRHLAALPERRHRQDDPLQPQGRRERPRRDLLPHRRACSAPASISTATDEAEAPAARRHQLAVGRGRVELAHPGRPQRALLALEPEQRLEHEPRDPRLERVPDHLRARRLRPALPDLAGGLPSRLGRRPRLHQRAQLRRHRRCRSARTAAARSSSPSTPSSASTRAASRDRYADYWQQNVAHARINHAYCVRNPQRLQGLRPRLLGPDGQRQPARLRRALADQRPRGHHPDRGARVLPLHAGALDAGAPALLPSASATASGATTASSTPSARPPTGTPPRTSRSTRARSS